MDRCHGPTVQGLVGHCCSLSGQGLAGRLRQLPRTGLAGWCVDSPGLKLAAVYCRIGTGAGVLMLTSFQVCAGLEAWSYIAARLTGFMLGLSLAMSEACLWACHGSVVSTCRYVY